MSLLPPPEYVFSVPSYVTQSSYTLKAVGHAPDPILVVHKQPCDQASSAVERIEEDGSFSFAAMPHFVQALSNDIVESDDLKIAKAAPAFFASIWRTAGN